MKRFYLFFVATSLLSAQSGVLTYHNDNQRTGVNPAETILTPANVNSSSFGKLFTIPVDGRVDAEPLYVPNVTIPGSGFHNVLYVVTEHDSAYAFDADDGSPLWHISTLMTGETTSDDRNCGQVTPEIGITATPVIDLAAGPHGAMYIVSMSKNGSAYFQRLHALDMTTGAELFGGPVDVSATYPGTGDNSSKGVVVFDPKQYKERPGLLLLNGIVYTAWSSHCDIRPYTGWIMGYNQTTLQQVSVLNLDPHGSELSIWQSGAGMATDASGNIYFLAANGTFDTTLNSAGFPASGDYGNAFMKLSTTGGKPAVADYFATFDTVSQSAADSDLGSGGALVLPDLKDSHGVTRHLAVGAGKDKNIYVVDRENMGKFNPSNNSQVYQELVAPLSGGVFSMPAFFNGWLYYVGVGDNLKAFQFSNGLFVAPPSSKSASTFGYPGATPSVSSNGLANGIVWATENTDPAVLHAYDATNLGKELYNSNQAANARDNFGTGNKFITPLIANGKVYVGTTNGVGVFGPLSCQYTVSHTSIGVGLRGGSGRIAVTAGPGCAWWAYNTSDFVSLGTTTSGNGNSTVEYTIRPNRGATRSGSIAIAGHTITVTQAGASDPPQEPARR